MTTMAARVLPSLGDIRWEEPTSRAAMAPLLRALEGRGLTPESFAALPLPRRNDEAFGAALEARTKMAVSLQENAAAVAALPAGDPALPRAVAHLQLLGATYAPYLNAAERDAARSAFRDGRGKLTEPQEASLLALARSMARALGSSADEDAAEAAAEAARPEHRGFFTPHRGPPEKRDAFVPPKPNALVMAASVPLARALLATRFRLRAIDLPRADAARLRAAASPDRAVFLAPNHPEFMTDMLMDKVLSARFAPRMASWASVDFAKKIFPWFWSRNNLVPSDGGRDGMAWTSAWALKGHGVLVHAEGSVHWTSGLVHPLFPGLAEMALGAAADAKGRPVAIAPLVWMYVYETDISAALNAEMSLIEKALGLPKKDRDRGPLEMRFFHLQNTILRRQMRRFGYAGDETEPDLFTRQEAFRDWLIADLRSRHPVEEAENAFRTLNRLQKAVRADPAALDEDRAKLAEARRLGGFSREAYDTPTLTQEQIFESLKRVRATLMTRGWRGLLEKFFPRPLGPRVAHVRTAQPILVAPARAGEEGAARDSLLARVHEALQRRLDGLRAELSPVTARFARPNPFHVPAP